MPAYNTYTDQKLIILLKNSDERAYNEIYHRFKAVLYGHAYNKLRNREEVVDLLQELFSSLWLNREKLDVNVSLSAYLYGAIRNQVFKLIRRKSTDSRYYESIRLSIQENVCETDYRVREKQLAALIEEAIDELPGKMREMFVMSRKLHMSHREIGKMLNVSESTVKKQVANALKNLRIKLGLVVWILMLFKY